MSNTKGVVNDSAIKFYRKDFKMIFINVNDSTIKVKGVSLEMSSIWVFVLKVVKIVKELVCCVMTNHNHGKEVKRDGFLNDIGRIYISPNLSNSHCE